MPLTVIPAATAASRASMIAAAGVARAVPGPVDDPALRLEGRARDQVRREAERRPDGGCGP